MIYVLSGGAGLNYTVVGGTTQPSNLKENTIWVSTDADITGYIFSPTEPTASAGLVWIQTGNGSTSFNAIKKNSIVLRPSAVKQYIGSAWVTVTAYIYQNSALTLISQEKIVLYSPGNTQDATTGGYSSIGKSWGSDYSYSVTAPSVTYNTDNMVMYLSYKYKSGMVFTKNKINLANINTLTLKGTGYLGQDGGIYLGLWTDTNGSYVSSNRAAAVSVATDHATTTINQNLDVSSLDDSYYIGYCLCSGYGGNAQLTVTDLYGEW